jgi:uncharacterized protein YqfA (UPF0365 family)
MAWLPPLAQQPAQILLLIGLAFLLLVALAALVIITRYFRFWIQSYMTNAGIGILDLLGMTFRKVDPKVIVRARIMAVQAGLGDQSGVASKGLEALYLSGGHVELVIKAIIAAQRARLNLDFKQAAKIDLAGRNVLEAVQTSVNPIVIDCPPRGSAQALSAVAKNGIELRVRARVTVRANLNQIIGGAKQETIIARVGEGIVSAIGSAETHSEVLANPDRISKKVLSRRLDSQTAFEIVSIDIADIEVGNNIGARLQADQAEADTRVARANAEGRRAMAVAQEQENIAHIEENRARLVEAQAAVPLAMAEAFQSASLGILDYYKLRNVQADTEMRNAIAGVGHAGRGATPS